MNRMIHGVPSLGKGAVQTMADNERAARILIIGMSAIVGNAFSFIVGLALSDLKRVYQDIGIFGAMLGGSASFAVYLFLALVLNWLPATFKRPNYRTSIGCDSNLFFVAVIGCLTGTLNALTVGCLTPQGQIDNTVLTAVVAAGYLVNLVTVVICAFLLEKLFQFLYSD